MESTVKPLLEGRTVRLEPLDRRHVDGLVAASSQDPSLYRWSTVPAGKAEAESYVETAMSWRDAGTAEPFAIVRRDDDRVLGSTRFFDIARWAWPDSHPRHRRTTPDVCEIGYTWLSADAIRTGVNTECKLLLLTHAFESWDLLRVCFHTDARNERSRAAIERIGGKFEGELRAHRLAADITPRTSFRYSILIDEWPQIKRSLQEMLTAGQNR